MACSTPSSSVLHYLLEFAQIHVHWVGDAIQPSHLRPTPFLLLPSIFPSVRVFSSESALWIRWPKYWSFSFSISPFNEYSGLISFRIDWLDLLAVQGTLKSLRQHHNLKALILQHSVFFIVQQQPVLRFSGILTACIHLLTSGFGSLFGHCIPTLHMLFILRRNPQSGQRDPIWRAPDWFWPKPKGLSRTRTPKEMLPGGQWYFRNCATAFPFWVCPLWVYHSWILRN